jgi:hypothetical protein
MGLSYVTVTDKLDVSLQHLSVVEGRPANEKPVKSEF